MDGSEARNINLGRSADRGSFQERGDASGTGHQGAHNGSDRQRVTQLHLETPISSVPRAIDGPLQPEKLAEVLDYITENLGTSMQLADLSKVAAISPFHFSRRFKSAMGVSPYRFIMHQRVEHAKTLLQQSDLALSDIALSCGFANQPHFTTVFRKIAGLTPAVFRRQLKRPKANGPS